MHLRSLQGSSGTVMLHRKPLWKQLVLREITQSTKRNRWKSTWALADSSRLLITNLHSDGGDLILMFFFLSLTIIKHTSDNVYTMC